MQTHPVWKLFCKIALVLAPFGLLFLFISLRTPYITYIEQARVEDKIQQLVVRAPQAPQAIIAGDSRAEDNVIPALFTQQSGLSLANVGSGGEILSQAYEALAASKALNQHRLIIMSVSIYNIGDGMLDAVHDDPRIINKEPWGRQKIKDILSYAHAFADYYIEHFKNTLRFDTPDNIHISTALLATGGYDAQDSTLVVPAGSTPPNPDTSWYNDARSGGLHQEEFVQSLQKLGDSNDTIVIYIGPIAPLWKESSEPANIQAADQQFAKVIEQAIAPYPNMHFIDFQDQNNPTMQNDMFADRVHLNATGAAAFTTLLVDTLRSRGIIK